MSERNFGQELLHTPGGVRDIYGAECASRLKIQQELHQVMISYGFRDIQTPTFEYFDIFSKEKGSVQSQAMFKFFDRGNNTLVLRPDMTPPIARCVAKYYMDETKPLRLCYLGPTFINGTSYQGRLKESTQTGAELIGDDTADADAEMIAMVIDALRETGLKEFQVELGQVEFYRGLVEESGMDEETQEKLRILIENKNYFGVEELLSEQTMGAELKKLFLKLPELFGDIDQIRLAKSMTTNARALGAIRRLEEVQEILDSYGLGDYVSYDLGMLSKYSYYTGIIFKAYTYGTGEYIVAGGRYDKLLEQFGKKAAAVGFAIMADQLLLALSRQKIRIDVKMNDTIILYDQQARDKAIRLACQFRNAGIPAQLTPRTEAETMDAYLDYARRFQMHRLISLPADGSTAVVYNTETGVSVSQAYTETVRDYIH